MGTVFAIEEFSTYDGPGIRMSVFLKGCPLRCMWCHNPEGQRSETEMLRRPAGCLQCGACLREGEKKIGVPCLVKESVWACPRNLIRVCGESYTAETLTEKIMKNAAILQASGGGVTFSGGEPLMQADFLLSCLRQLEGRIHRAVQTCGYADTAVFSKVLAHCDYMLYDLKLMDSEKHRYYTGVSNEKILANYRHLVASSVPFCTRIPLIPTVNDTVENLEATAKFLRECGTAYLELLPYNTMAGGKYAMLGREYQVDFEESAKPCTHEEIFQSYGIEVRVL